MSLYPTPTRKRLLADVGARWVFRDAIGDSYIQGDTKVTAAIAELEQAGWVRLATVDRWGVAFWEITDAGRAVLKDGSR